MLKHSLVILMFLATIAIYSNRYPITYKYTSMEARCFPQGKGRIVLHKKFVNTTFFTNVEARQQVVLFLEDNKVMSTKRCVKIS